MSKKQKSPNGIIEDAELAWMLDRRMVVKLTDLGAVQADPARLVELRALVRAWRPRRPRRAA